MASTEKPMLFNGAMVRALLDGRKTQTRRLAKGQALDWLDKDFTPEFVADQGNKLSPYGYSGDCLWVRETFHSFDDGRVRYRADGCWNSDDLFNGPWTPSIHMPRRLSRITLEITEVRVQRIQGISEADAMAEGAAPTLVPPDGGSSPHVEGFRDIWDSCYPGSWDRNDWVWVYSFTRISPEAR